MEILNATDACFVVDGDLLDFTLEADHEDEDPETFSKRASASSLKAAACTGLCPEFVEEELEWLSNKDAFPSVETCFGISSDNPELILNHQSPVSVLESSSISSTNDNGSIVASCFGSLKVPSFPSRPRSKIRRRKRKASFGELLWSSLVNVENKQESSVLLSPTSIKTTSSSARMGRRCLHCQVDKTPQWRAGPMGPKTLCNACGVRYKSGRLLPEYRPVNSPTFSTKLHSNSHRKVIEMRRQKFHG